MFPISVNDSNGNRKFRDNTLKRLYGQNQYQAQQQQPQQPYPQTTVSANSGAHATQHPQSVAIYVNNQIPSSIYDRGNNHILPSAPPPPYTTNDLPQPIDQKNKNPPPEIHNNNNNNNSNNKSNNDSNQSPQNPNEQPQQQNNNAQQQPQDEKQQEKSKESEIISIPENDSKQKTDADNNDKPLENLIQESPDFHAKEESSFFGKVWSTIKNSFPRFGKSAARVSPLLITAEDVRKNFDENKPNDGIAANDHDRHKRSLSFSDEKPKMFVGIDLEKGGKIIKNVENALLDITPETKTLHEKMDKVSHRIDDLVDKYLKRTNSKCERRMLIAIKVIIHILISSILFGVVMLMLMFLAETFRPLITDMINNRNFNVSDFENPNDSTQPPSSVSYFPQFATNILNDILKYVNDPHSLVPEQPPDMSSTTIASPTVMTTELI